METPPYLHRGIHVNNAANLLQDQKMTDDFERAQFGDTRLDARSHKIALALASKPEESLPEVFEDDQELQNNYEFFRHDWLSFFDLTRPHFEATAERCGLVEDEISVIHDTTQFDFPLYEEKRREHLARFSSKRQGFLGHASLAIASGEVACPLGYIAYQPFVHQKHLEDESSRAFWEKLDGVFDHEPNRWKRGIEQAESQLRHVSDVVHIYDAEGDNYRILTFMKQRNYRFISRLKRIRRVTTTDGEGHLRDVMSKRSVSFTRELWVTKKDAVGKVAPPKERRPGRSARRATLEVRTMRLGIERPRRAPKSWPEKIEVNVVHLREVEPPEGEEAVEWFLATTEPIETEEEVDRVVRKYKERWLIEEANKTIKTGCAYTKRRLGGAAQLLNLLAITLPVSLDLLRFRYLSQAVPDWPAQAVVTQRQLEILQTTSTRVKWSDAPTVAEATYAVAKIGGFLKRNKTPGWQTLSRGYQTLLEYEIGWVAARRSTGPPD